MGYFITFLVLIAVACMGVLADRMSLTYAAIRARAPPSYDPSFYLSQANSYATQYAPSEAQPYLSQANSYATQGIKEAPPAQASSSSVATPTSSPLSQAPSSAVAAPSPAAAAAHDTSYYLSQANSYATQYAPPQAQPYLSQANSYATQAALS